MLPVFHRSIGFLILLWAILVVPCRAQAAEAVDSASELRMQKYLPRLLTKLQRRARLRVSVMGDSLALAGKDFEEPLYAWHERFLERLAGKYFYSGGLREAVAKPKAAAVAPLVDFTAENAAVSLPLRGKLQPLRAGIDGGPEILLYNFCRKGATSMQALQVLTTGGFDDHPDLVIWMYGSHDAVQNVPVARYREALEQAIRLCKAQGTEMIIAGPPLICGPALPDLALTQPYVEAARTLAKQSGLLFVDFSAALGRVPSPSIVEAEAALAGYLQSLEHFYTHDQTVDRLHPNPLGHEVMAEAAWQTLLAAPTAEILQPRGSWTLANAAAGKAKLELTLFQPPTEVLPPEAMAGVVVTVLGQPGGWQRVGGPSFVVKEFTGKRQTIFDMEPQVGLTARAPFGETLPCSLILHEGGWSRLVQVPLIVVPLSVELPVARVEGVASAVILEGTVMNRQANELKGTAEVTWLESKFPIDLVLQPGVSKPLKLRLPLPSTPRAQGPLRVKFHLGDLDYVFERMVEAAQAFLPEQKLALHNAAKTTPAPQVTFRADAAGLYTRFELPPAKEIPNSHLAAQITLSIDARGPAEITKPGYVEPWTLEIPWMDGPIAIHHLRPAIFGNGYDRQINPATIRAALKTEKSGLRIVTIDIPKNDFYLHQWSLAATGENTLGINASVALAEPAGFSPASTWSLMDGGFHPTDAGSLGILQLTPAASGVWNVRVY